jgi:hypothetical protein
MIEVDKTYSDNPFVDELIYYSKYIALNCVIKDEEEALDNETVESLKAGQTYIACVEGSARFDMFDSFPEEILEKYISIKSNLDMMVDDIGVLTAYLNSMSTREKTTLMSGIDKLARTIYIDHYDIMTDYIETIGEDWLIENESLYNSCKDGTATYKDLFEVIPLYTRKRVIKQYIRNFDNTDLNEISKDLATFEDYCNNREEEEIEMINIDKAMRSIFQSHYDMIVERGYLNKEQGNNWWEYLQFENDYNACLDGTETYDTLFSLFPADDLEESLRESLTNLPEEYVSYILESVSNLNKYLASYTDKDLLKSDINTLNENMRQKYISNYNLTTNFDYYNKCKADLIGYEKLSKVMPKETNKIILNNFIQEVTNINVYANNLDMLLSYLSTLPVADQERIKNALAKEMESYYVDNYVELNNYYRIVMGLPPLDEEGNRYKDTLYNTYDETTGTTIKFGKTLVEMIPEGIYPDAHWEDSELYEFDAYDISLLTNYGVFDKFVELTGRSLDDKRYKYLKYLGDNALDIYTCRKALNFELMYVPTVDNTEIKNKFVDKYAVNRDFVLRTVYTEAHKFQSDYYNKFMIIFTLINTIMDVLADVPKLIIDREIFDARSIKYLFESFGIPYYSEIPLKYQQAMLKNLNILIKYKSSTRNMVDICSLFGFDDIKVFGYYMLKDRLTDSNTGNYLFKENNEIDYDPDDLFVIYPNGPFIDTESGIRFSRLSDYYDYDEDRYTHILHIEEDDGSITERRVINSDITCYVRSGDTSFIPIEESDYYVKIKQDIQPCDVKFIKVPIEEQLTEYKNDDDYHNAYDDITLADDTWDGGLLHEKIKNDILDYEFNAVRTKYISVETVTQLTEMAFQVSYFYNMLFDNLYSEDNLTIEIPFIRTNHKFRFTDVVCYLFAMMYLYHGLSDKIMYSPTQILYVKGYNYNEDLNLILQDQDYFTQTSNPMDQKNIFSINEMIAKNAYSYQEAFENYRIKSFNLDADMDALNTWLSYYQYANDDSGNIRTAHYYTETINTLGLDKFIVMEKDDPNNTFNRELTLWDFYSLNNSHYQKDIFKNNLAPIEYNQIIRYGFDCDLLEKIIYTDINAVETAYCVENEELGVIINDTDQFVYVINNERYALKNKGKENIVLYNLFDRNNCKLDKDTLYYRLDGVYYPLFNVTDGDNVTTEGLIYIKDNNGDYVYAATKYFTKVDKGTEYTFEEITDDTYFITETLYDSYGDEYYRTLLNIGDYFESERDENGNFVLHPYNDYIIVYQNDEPFFVLYTDIGQYENAKVPEEDMFIQDEDDNGIIRYVKLTDSDFFEPTWDPEDDYAFIEENCFVQVDEETEYFDPDVPDIYYMRITDYYDKTDYKIDDSLHYVKDINGNYIPVTSIINPNNCYVYINNGYYLVADQYVQFCNYLSPKIVSNMYILNDDNFYDKFTYSLTDDITKYDTEDLYVNESSDQYVLVIYANRDYDVTKRMVVVLNKALDTKSSSTDDDESGLYDPEKTDGIWDENDWFYNDISYDPDSNIGMNGENKWYYKKPGSENTPKEDNEVNYEPVGSGFYLAPESYLGSVELEEGEKYFIAMDVECNFEGRVKIACDADSDNTEIASRTYNTKVGEIFHVSQTFIANSTSRPRLVFFMYNYDEYPINRGDYFIIRNIIVVKSHSDNYIPQDIPSYDKLQEMFKINQLCYDYLCKCMVNCTDYKTYQVYQKIYDTLMISEYNKEMFKLSDGTYAETYTEFLQHRDSVLYEKLVYFKSLDTEAMQKSIADNIIEVTYAMDDCVDTYSYGYLYSYFPAVSASYIQQYICKIIDFFKSWKVHLLGINTIYRFDDELENTVKILYDDQMKNTIKTKDTVYVNDTLKINPLDDVDPDNIPYSDKYKDLIMYTHYADDKYDIKDGIKIYSMSANTLRYRDNEVDLILDDEEVNAYTDDDGNLIIENSDGFSIAIPNNLMYDNTGDIENELQINLNSIPKTNTILIGTGHMETETYDGDKESIKWIMDSIDETIEINEDNMSDYINVHKEDIVSQVIFDARSINEVNLKTFTYKED